MDSLAVQAPQVLDSGRTLTPAEQEALVYTLGRMARVWKAVFVFMVLLTFVCAALTVVTVGLVAVGGGGTEAGVITVFLAVVIPLLSGFLAAIRGQVFGPVEPQVREAPPLACLRGSFETATVGGGAEGGEMEVLTISGLHVAVPDHWPPPPSPATALVFLPLVEAEAPAWRRRYVPMVVEVAGWRSLNDDLESGVLPSDGLRFRTHPHAERRRRKPTASVEARQRGPGRGRGRR